MRKILLLILMPFSFLVLAQEIKTETFYLEKTPVQLQVSRYGSKADRILYLNVHENESTSVEAAREYLPGKNGIFVAVKQSGNRNLSFELKGVTYQIDPNRMFTKAGRIASLKLLNGSYTNAAEEEVEEFSDKIISRVKSAKIVVALHNNTNGKPLSVNSYRNKYVNPKMDTDDFIITTEKSIFDQLKAKKINVVWETIKTSSDDGSLAYYCSKKNIPYMNIEAKHGHKAEQLKMLNAVTDIVNQYNR